LIPGIFPGLFFSVHLPGENIMVYFFLTEVVKAAYLPVRRYKFHAGIPGLFFFSAARTFSGRKGFNYINLGVEGIYPWHFF